MGNESSRDLLGTAISSGPCGTDPFSVVSFDDTDLPRGLKFSMKFLTPEQFEFCRTLCELGQDHLFDGWENMDKQERLALAEQLISIDDEMEKVGGLENYIVNAQKMLSPKYYDAQRKGMQLMNSTLRGWSPSVPAGSEAYSVGSEKYAHLEEVGLKELGKVGFCIVATESANDLLCDSKQDENAKMSRLQLPMDLETDTSYLQYFIEYILAVSDKYMHGSGGSSETSGSRSDYPSLPLCIMTSNETHEAIQDFLDKHDNFGMDSKCITLVCRQYGVPAFSDSSGRMALDPLDNRLVLTQSPGHGDFHTLMHESGTAKKWLDDHGLKWMYMMERETNGLAFASLPVMLGVSEERGLIMNSLAVPRKARDETMGAVCALRTKKHAYKTASVESRELTALLQSDGYKEGEANDKKTGLSPFPGNTNQLLFDLEEYVVALEERRGIIPKFINAVFDGEATDDDDDDFDEKSHRMSSSQSIKSKNSRAKRGSPRNDENALNGAISKLKSNGGLLSAAKGIDSVISLEEQTFLLKEPERLQSRIQDFVHMLPSSLHERVGFTTVGTEAAFSPVVHSVASDMIQSRQRVPEAAQTSVDAPIEPSQSTLDRLPPPYTAASAEADQSALARKFLELLGCHIETADPVTYSGGIQVVPGPTIIFKANFGTCLTELRKKFPNPEKVHISARSTLIIRGDNVVVESLDLDGCMLIDCDETKSVKVQNQVICNKGWERVKDPYASEAVHRMRGYHLNRKDAEIIEMTGHSQSDGCAIM